MLAIKNVKRKKQLTMKKTSIIKGIYALPIIVLLSCLFHVISLTDKLQEQIEQRDKTIQDLAFSDSLVHKYFLIKKDSIKKEDSIITTTTYILKEEYQPKEITKYTDIHHYHSVQYEKTEYALRGNDTLSLSSSIQETKQLVAKYNALVKDYNALGNKYNLLVKENGALDKSYQASQMALGLIKRSYDIDYHVEDEGENQIKVSISAEKADSAFMLLPYYRKKLKFDNIKNVWIIK